MKEKRESPILSVSEGRSAVALSLERAWGLPRYSRIVRRLRNVDVSADPEFSRDFNCFFRVRRNRRWQACFYAELERLKCSDPQFDRVLRSLYEKTGSVEASFASKLAAIVDPNMPIMDSKVLSFLHLKTGGSAPEQRISAAIEAYRGIAEWYGSYLKTPESAEILRFFDTLLPRYSWLSDVKKVDFLLWSLGDAGEPPS